ncbi:MAG: DUF4258 domain-containing protein [Planctomycetota bacterium]
MNGEASFTISGHARRRMTQRGITDGEIRRVLMNPDRVERDPDDTELMHAVKRFFREGDSVVLRVVYNEVRRPWRIVTVYCDRKARRKQ